MRRPRFSLAALMLLLTVCAGGLAVWRAFIFEPPTHRIALYERAPGMRGRFIDIGPNRIGLRLLARNDRDGSILYDKGRSSAARLAPADKKEIAAAATWLDVAQIELESGPAQTDIIETRIFDHEERELLAVLDRAYGWQQTAANKVQVYGLGRRLPDKVDVWFRAHSYAAGDLVVKLAASVGSTSSIAGATVTLRDIRPGSWSFSNNQLRQRSDHNQDVVSTVIGLSGPASVPPLQIAAVTADGKKIHMDGRHFVTFGTWDESPMPIPFATTMDEIDHFEVRPFGGRETFFFEGVALPTVSARPFSKRPVVTISVGGKETNSQLQAWAPLDVRFLLTRGRSGVGTYSSGEQAGVLAAEEVSDQDKAFMLSYWGQGLNALPLQFRFIDARTKQRLTDAQLKHSSNGSSRGATVCAGYIEYESPLERIESVEIGLGP
jgi:hypothetical protein